MRLLRLLLGVLVGAAVALAAVAVLHPSDAGQMFLIGAVSGAFFVWLFRER